MEKFNEAFKYHQEGQLTKARDLYDEILKKQPENDEVWDLLGLLYLQVGDFEKSEKCILKAISIQKRIYYFENIARLYLQKGDFEKAKDYYEFLIQTSPSFDNYFNLGMTYKGLGDYEKVIESYNNALKINPDNCEVYFNLASVYIAQNELPKAIDCYKKTIKLKPDDWESEYFLSLAYMQSKDYKNGLKCFETRLCRQSAIYSQCKTYPELMKKRPLYEGQDTKEKTLYTYYEAGFGDVIMLYRFMPELTSKFKKVIFKPQKELVPLFRQNSYGAEIMDTFVSENELDFDYHLPFLSVPYVLGKTEENLFIHHDDGYLKASPQKTEYFKNKFFNNTKFKIGIKWQGNTYYEKERVLRVEDFYKLFKIPNTQFYSCQTFEGSEEFEKIRQNFDVIDLAPEFHDFSDTAGAVENMDLIICNDTSLAHLAGAMRKPCWIILPYVYNWRWHTDLSKCDWYDSVKLYRQPSPGNWQGVFEEIEKDLINLVC